MSLPILLLWLVSIPILAHAVKFPDPLGYLLNCGGEEPVNVGDQKYLPDRGYIFVGNTSTIQQPGLLPILSTLRYFPNTSARKYCFVIPVNSGEKFLVRTIYYYGGFDGGKEPPVFDQIVEGTKWSTVNTTEDYNNGLTSYYEIVVVATGRTLRVCLARNGQTGNSSPFISALVVEHLDASLYNTTDFSKYALSTVARSTFGDEEDMITFPDDKFNRLWQPFKDQNPVVSSHSNITSSDFWNLPPVKVFNNAITTSRGKPLKIQWPPVLLPGTNYYISLYFQDVRSPSPFSWRVFDVSVNDKKFFTNLNVTTNGVTVYATQWPLSGQTEITLTPADGIPVGPLINAGEVLQILPLGGRTQSRDVMAMEDLARSFNNPPPDWSGDPCLPKENSWTGVTCSKRKYVSRVVSVNLTNAELSGSLPSSIANLTSLNHLWLGGNELSSTIPEMSTLKELQTLHLEDNQFEGPIPQSLGQLPKLREIFLQNNNLDAKVPQTLQKRTGINIQVASGNHQSQST